MKKPRDLSSKMKLKNIRTSREKIGKKRTFFTYLQVKPEIIVLIAPEPTRGYPDPHRVPVTAAAAAAASAFPFISQEPEMYDME